MSAIGGDIGISTVNPNQIQLMGKAQLMDSMCCVGPRTYFYVLENAYEYNTTFYICGWSPAALCCTNQYPDITTKVYFDRGMWNTLYCSRQIGCVSGQPIFFGHNPKHVCCCMECPSCYDDCVACSFPCWCGDRVHYTPYGSACWGLCPAKATACCNCFGLCGVKTGEPLCTSNLVSGLLPGSGEQLVTALEHARASWSARTNKP